MAGPLAPLNDLQRNIAALATLPALVGRMVKDVRLMREAVEDLPKEVAQLRLSVESLHADMKNMVDDVHELKGLQQQLDELNGSLARLPFMRPSRAQRKSTPPPEAA